MSLTLTTERVSTASILKSGLVERGLSQIFLLCCRYGLWHSWSIFTLFRSHTGTSCPYCSLEKSLDDSDDSLNLPSWSIYSLDFFAHWTVSFPKYDRKFQARLDHPQDLLWNGRGECPKPVVFSPWHPVFRPRFWWYERPVFATSTVMLRAKGNEWVFRRRGSKGRPCIQSCCRHCRRKRSPWAGTPPPLTTSLPRTRSCDGERAPACPLRWIKRTIDVVFCRVVFVQIIALFWNTYMAWKISGSSEQSAWPGEKLAPNAVLKNLQTYQYCTHPTRGKEQMAGT